MKKSLLLSAAAALVIAGSAIAQPYHGPGPGPGGPGRPGGPHHWAHGERMPAEYWHHGHEVNWQRYHLR